MSMAQTDMIRGDIAEVMVQAEYNGGGIDTLKQNALLNAGSVVKSIQRGQGTTYSLDKKAERKIASISSVNVDKSILISNFTFRNGGGSVNNTGMYLKNNGVYVNRTDDTGYWSYLESYSWQVIEFY